MDLLKTAFLGAFLLFAAVWGTPAFGQGCECLNCPQNLPAAGLDTCYEREFLLQVRGAVNDDLSDPFQGICAVNVRFQHNYVWSLEMYLISPSGDTLQLTGPSIISGYASSALSSWDIQFIPAQFPPDPDPGFEGVWSNDQLWEVFKKYTGKYHPAKGKLEDLDTGPINGTWRILVRNCTEIESGKFLDFSLVFCDETGIDCNCQAFGGRLTTDPAQRICQGDSSLGIMPEPFFFGAPPDTMQYGYIYVIARDGAIVEFTENPDLIMAAPGNYEVCGLSYALADLDSIPQPDGVLSIQAMRDSLFGDAPPFCGDVSTGCLRIEIGKPLPVQVIDTTICAGQCFRLGATDFCQSVVTRDTFQAGNGCDSIVELRLTVLPPASSFRRDTICQEDFVIIGNNFFNKTGLYQVTLNDPKTGCDSLVIMDLFVLEVNALATVSQKLGCFASEVTLQGGGSSWNFESPEVSWIAGVGGNILSGESALIARVDQPGSYSLRIAKTLANGKVCADTSAVTVQFDPLKPDLVAPASVDFCEGSAVALSGLPVADQNGLGGLLLFYAQLPFVPANQVGPLLEPVHGDSVFAFYSAGDCLDTVLIRFQEVEAPKAELLPYVTVCNQNEGGAFNTLILFDSLLVQSNTLGSWANTDMAPVSGAFPLIDFQGVPGPMSYTFTWTSVKATAPCPNISVSMEVFVEHCACPSVATQPPGPFCQDGSDVLLSDFLITAEPGTWFMVETPPGNDPALIQMDSLLVGQRDTGLYRIVFRLESPPPPGCPDSAFHFFRINPPPFATVVSADTVCNDGGSGTHPVQRDLGSLVLEGDGGGFWLDTDLSGAAISGDTADFQGVLPGTYIFSYTTASAQPPCQDKIYGIPLTVLDCTCSPLAVQTSDTLCNDLLILDLSHYLLEGGEGAWSLLQQPPGAALPAPVGDQLSLNGSVAGSYRLLYTLSASPGGACPESDTLELFLAEAPLAQLAPGDSICNSNAGLIPYVLDLGALILASNFQGNWVDLEGSGASGVGAMRSFLGVPPGQYDFLFVSQGAMAPCADKSFPVTIQVLDCSCPELRDTTYCLEDGVVDLADLAPAGLNASWSVSSQPVGSPAIPLLGSTWVLDGAVAGKYSFAARWQRPSGNACGRDSAQVSVDVISPPELALRPFLSACNDNGPYGSSQILLDSLLVLGPKGGQWQDIDQSGAGGSAPLLDFTGVADGEYRFVYKTPEQAPCGSQADTLTIRVGSCLCPPVKPGQPPPSCNGADELDLSPWSQGLAAGSWSIVEAPPGQWPASILGSTLRTGGRDPGIYTLAYQLSQAPPQGCADSAQVLLELQAQPYAGQVGDTLILCAGQPVALDLASLVSGEDPGGRWFSSTNNPSLISGLDTISGIWKGLAPTIAGIYRIAYRLNGTQACPADTSWVLVRVVSSPTANAGPDRTLGCNEPPVLLGIAPAPGSAVLHRWFRENQFLGQQDLWPASEPGIYVLVAEDPLSGCLASDSVVVTASSTAPSDLVMQITQPLCDEANGQLAIQAVVDGTAPYLYRLGTSSWLPVGTFQGLPPGNYTLEVQDANGCRFDTAFTLVGKGAFQVSLGPDLIVPAGSMLTLSATLTGTPGVLEEIIWEPSGIGCPTCLLADITVSSETAVTVRVRTADGCESTDELRIGIERLPRRFWAPTAFSPDFNGINDRFMLFGNELMVMVSSLEVFDRWGNMLYAGRELIPNGSDAGWDGTFEGRMMDPGVYVYRATLLFADGTELAVKGDVQLVR